MPRTPKKKYRVMTQDELKQAERSLLAERALRRWINYWAIAQTIEILHSYKATRTIHAVMVTRWWFGEPLAPRHVEAILRIVPFVDRRYSKELLNIRQPRDNR